MQPILKTVSDPTIADSIAEAHRLRTNGDFAGAIATLMPHVSLNLDGAFVTLTLGQFYSESGDLEKAGRWLKRARQCAPDSLNVRMAWGTWLAQTGQYREAIAELNGVFDEAHERVQELQARQRWDDVIEMVDLAYAAYGNMARTLFDGGEPESARFIAEENLNCKDCWEWAHAIMADVVELQGLDPLETARAGLEKGMISPLMVDYLLNAMLEFQPDDLAAVDKVVQRADEIFGPRFAWWTVDEELFATLEGLRQRALQAMMRGKVGAADVARLVKPVLTVEAFEAARG